MKPESMSKAFLVLFAVLTAVFIFIAWPFAKAAFLAFTLAVIFFPVQRAASKRFKLNRYLLAVLTTLVVAICVIFPMVVLIGVVVSQISDFLQMITLDAHAGTLSDAFGQLLITVHGWIEKLWGQAPPIEEIRETIISALAGAGKKFYALSPRVLSTTISIVANFLLMPIFLVVFLAEGGALFGWIMESIPLTADHRSELASDVRVMITSSIVAAIITALVQGSLLGAGFWAAGFQRPFEWALVAIILSIIPVVGAASCYITATTLLLSAGNIKGAIIFLIFGVVVISGSDNIIKPLIMRSKKMHPLLLFVVLIGSVNLFGPIGLLVGPVLLSIFLASLNIYRREFIRAK